MPKAVHINLKMMGVGNEQWDEQYIERYKVFSAAIKAKYPNIKLITSAGPSPDGKQFDYLWGELRKLHADVVHMASYAPLFARVDAWQWRPDLIWFDNLRVVATPNYYVQKLFSNNKGTNVVPIVENNEPLAGKDSLYASATIDKKQMNS